MAEGRDVQVFGSYGGMMRGGATEATIVVADGPVESPPTVGDDLVGGPHAPRARRPCPGLPRDRAAWSWSTRTVVVRSPGSTDAAPTVVEVPASDLAVEVGHVMAASMVMIGASRR